MGFLLPETIPNSGKGPYKIGRQFARTLFERVEWVGGAAESKKLSDDKNV